MNIIRKILRVVFKPIYWLSVYLYPERCDSLSNSIDNVSSRVDDISNKIEGLSKHIEENQRMSYDLKHDFEILSENVRNINAMLNGYENVIVNLQNLNSETAKLKSDNDRMHFIINQLKKNGAPTAAPLPVSKEESKTEISVPSDNYYSIDYFDFENHFRGSREQIKERQSEYLSYFEKCKNVIDIGCGRGEFLELMLEHDIPAVGVDIYEPFVEYCREKGFDAVLMDGTDYLRKCAGCDGIFAGQVIEHLSIQQIIALIDTAFEKLSDGGVLILETPNPCSLSIYVNAFYLDPSHIKPVHPETMRYLLKNAGFRNIDVVYTQSSMPGITIPKLKGEDEFNLSMETVQNMLFASQDYAIIARK